MGNAMFNFIAKKKQEEVKIAVDSLFKISAETITGDSINLGDYAKEKNLKCIMVVNVASACGLTDDHYKELV